GTVTYAFYTAGGVLAAGSASVSCQGTPAFTSTVTVSNGNVPPSAPFTPNSAGTYNVGASYSGDAADAPATSPCSAETITVTRLSQTITVTTHAPSSTNPGTSFPVAATASSELPVMITAAGACTVPANSTNQATV